MEGWISLHRKIKEHWLWSNALYLRAWIQMILDVNHLDSKVLIEGELIECKRGQSLKSLSTWAKDFGNEWTIQKVRTFFKLLQSDNMILIEGLRKTTRITISKYDTYQNLQQANNKQLTSKQQTANTQLTTNNNDNNDNNDNNENNNTDFDLFWNSYHSISCKEKSDKESALKYWKKLTTLEKKKALYNIQAYCDSISDKKYIKKARTYLSDKNFNDEFTNVKTEIPKSTVIPQNMHPARKLL